MATAGENDAPTPMFKKVAFTCYQVKDAKRARALLFATSDAKTNSDSGAMIAFEVEDLDSLKARLKTEGVAFKAEMIASPVCRMSIIVDSEGNAVMLHELRKK